MLLLEIDAESDEDRKLVINGNSDNIVPLNAPEKKSVDKPPSLEELIIKQPLNKYCGATSVNGGHAKFGFYFGHRGLLARNSIINKSILIVAPASL